jgi:hypothetical protein
MAIQTWVSGTIGNWFDPANWTTGEVPELGDGELLAASPLHSPFSA